MANGLDLVNVDKARFVDAIEMYFLWKELDTRIRGACTRGINIPEAITEMVLCYATGYKLSKGSGGDAFDSENNLVIEIKATSNWDRDTTSFSPKEEFDKLFFVRLDKRNDVFYLYDTNINSELLKKIKVNAKETLEVQQGQGRRPRFSIIKFIIEQNDVRAFAKVDLREKKVIKL